MKIPGFTAEASLYKTNDYCQAIIVANHANGIVQPAMTKKRGCIKRICHDEWVC